MVETVAFGVAALVHAGVLVHGYQHDEARIAESVISLVLLTGLVVSWIRPERTRDAGVGAQRFALVGIAVGVFTIIVGVGPQTAPDVVYHIVILAVLAWGVVLAVRMPRHEDAPEGPPPPEKGVAAPRATAALAAAVALGRVGPRRVRRRLPRRASLLDGMAWERRRLPRPAPPRQPPGRADIPASRT